MEKYSITGFIVGGKIKSKTSSTVGFSAIEFLKSFNFDYSFIGANAFNINGYSTPDPEEAMVKSQVIERSKAAYFLCDHSKLNKTSFINFASLNKGILVTDLPLPKIFNNLLKVEVVKWFTH